MRIHLFAVPNILLAFCTAAFAGQFGPVAKYKIADGVSANYVALGDFNGDGVLDIAVTPQPSELVYLLLGNGDGRFQPATSFFGSGVALVRGLACGDFNGDGKLDLAVASADSDGGAVNIVLGNGDGTFRAPVYYPAGAFPVSVAVGDFNRDGTPDLAVMNSDGGSSSGGVAVLLGNGGGTFQPEVYYSAGVNPNSLALADFNGDGIPDLATGTTGSIVAVLLGNGDGTFQKAIRNSVGVNPHYVGVGDFNNDGKVDVVATLENTTIGSNKVVVSLGNGDGTLQAPITFSSPPKPQATVVADFNRDGFLDLGIGALNNGGLDGIYFLKGQAGGTFLHSGNYPTGNLVPIATAVGDLNRDGYPDLVVVDGGVAVNVLLNAN